MLKPGFIAFSVLSISMLTVSACGGSPATPDVYFEEVVTAARLPTEIPTETFQPSELPTVTPTSEQVTLESTLAGYGLEQWEGQDPAAARYPISPEILENRSTYGAMIDELHWQLSRASKLRSMIEEAGNRARVELHWNGITSYTASTRVEVFMRDESDPERKLWILASDGSANLMDAVDTHQFLQNFPDSSATRWENPGTFRYLDDPADSYSRGMHLLDAEGMPVAFWDESQMQFVPWLEKNVYRHKIVNGFDLDFFGFEDFELDILWEAFQWIRLVYEDPYLLFANTESIRITSLPLWIAGVADQADIRIDPTSFTFFQDYFNAEREADVLWVAALIVHEAAHVNQPGECSPDYAATQGMSFQEYALYIETGPGQAYEQELNFWIGLRELQDESGKKWITDLELLEVVNDQIAIIEGTLGKDHFPNGELVPTCATG